MSNNQDARPFIDLKKDAEEFRAKFDDDIRECMSFLDTKITSLICDPDSLGNQVKSVKQNALTEFSKAKYDIFISVKSHINEKEREWLNYISEMKKLYIENVEIFLAGTKLEVKLPSSEFQPSHGPRKSPSNRKSNSSSVTSSIYPIITTITKNIPVLGSPLQRQEVPKKVSEEIFNVQFNRRSRLPASSIKLANSPSANTKLYQEESPSSSDSSENEDRREKETMDVDEAAFDKNVITGTTARGRRAAKAVIEEEIYEPGNSKSPKKVTFTADCDIGEDLDMYTPVARRAKSTARRKTLLPNLDNVLGADIIPGNPIRSTSKRKTISGASNLETAAPSKRLKVSSRKSVSSQEEDNVADDNLLESDDNYSGWMALKSVDGKVPTRPAIYEVKVWRAKKSAYIGSCESLRQMLTLYKLRQNSGHKHLDKFVERNYDDIQVRYEVVPSLDDAKTEVKNRIKRFVEQYKTTPAYN